MSDLSRRSFLLGSAALAACALGASSSLAQFASAPATSARFSSVAVDVEVLRAKGLGAYADFLKTALLKETRAVFADRIGGGGPRLVVRITGVSLNSYASGGPASGRHGRGGGGGGDNDYLEGEALIVGPRGEILARYPQLSVTPASYGGAWYDPLSEQRRTAILAQHYAQWLRRTIAG